VALVAAAKLEEPGLPPLPPHGASSGNSAVDMARRASMRAQGGKEEDEDVVRLTAGDLIYLERSDEFGGVGGIVFGDANLSALGVDGRRDDEGSGAPWRFNECVFRLTSKLDYRARDEYQLQLKNHNAQRGEQRAIEPFEAAVTAEVAAELSPAAAMVRHTDFDLAKERADMEARQNTAAMERMVSGEGKSVRYGDVVQLQHVPSGSFLTVHKDAAPFDVHCRRASLEGEGGRGAHFRIMPRYKIRAVGSPVLTGDGILVHSVTAVGVTLASGCGSGTKRPAAELPSPVPSPPPSAGGRGVSLPTVLAMRGPQVEVNGSMEARGGFTVCTLLKHHTPS